ncbi:MAG: hypothetical protein B6D72_11495 [gamma proteobacterium symbiont of Ctena orbiculata]|nr:MAG: hypothetical protein DBP00_18750 [gamma proteobacterium symbiont of Ctena orbiculata]PVV10852.1 MAG: hypothetical protein B6D72_11495 [gamma proteobacterium symbiont of Ctena orbiculata]PVV13261.1 MAG: hypothetical protein B6D82_08415 [gamma proteobacterium symbiont of Ctena orbiculata]PVV25496.1 MAG: hypothetical protein B6D74_03080 [gamma proteobacterium symbiont of Ctena orbiculata]
MFEVTEFMTIYPRSLGADRMSPEWGGMDLLIPLLREDGLSLAVIDPIYIFLLSDLKRIKPVT